MKTMAISSAELNKVNTLRTILSEQMTAIRASVRKNLPIAVGDIVKVYSPVASNKYRKVNAIVRNISVQVDFNTGEVKCYVDYTPRYVLGNRVYVPNTEYTCSLDDVYATEELSKTLLVAKTV